jgi:hypothetical protein
MRRLVREWHSAGAWRGAAACAATVCPEPGGAPAAPRPPLHRQQRRRASAIPDAVKAAFEAPGAPFTAALIPGAGRGLVATRAMGHGEVVLREAPLVAVPSPEHRSKVSPASCSVSASQRSFLPLLPGALPASLSHPLSSPRPPLPLITRAPRVTHPPPPPRRRCQVCYSCLSPLDPSGSPLLAKLPAGRAAAAFCSPACASAAEGSFFAFERGAARGLAVLEEHCLRRGERFPLLAARLAFALLQRRAGGPGGAAAGGGGGGGGEAAAASGGRQRGELQQGPGAPAGWEPLEDVSFLCFANVGPPPPEPWCESFGLLRDGIDSAVEQWQRGSGGGGGSGSGSGAAFGGSSRAGGGASGGDGSGGPAAGALARDAQALDLAWWVLLGHP